MKKFYLLIVMVVLGFCTRAQQWSVYDAGILPVESEFNFVKSNESGADIASNSTTIVDDPEFAGNKLLELNVPGADSKLMWRYNYATNPQNDITFVIRVKALSMALQRTIELDFYGGGFRERLFIKNDGNWELKESKVTGVLGVDPAEWHIYRITKSGAQLSFYIDENPVAISTVTTPTTSADNYFRFGDGNGGSTLGALIDWIIWDETGIYAPGEGAEIPAELIPGAETAWKMYEANETPDTCIYKFTKSNFKGIASINTIVPDTIHAGNNLLDFDVSGANSSDMWKYMYEDSLQKSITLVARMKALNTELNRTMEFDFQNQGFRERLYIKNDATFEVKEAALKGDLPIDPAGWHIYRIVKDSNQLSFYVDENPEPVSTTITATASAENYFRFGDGNTSSSLGATIDWIIWDETGAYAPGEGTAIPASLVTDVDVVVLSSDASLASIEVSSGTLKPAFDKEVFDYSLAVALENPSVTVTATATDPKATVEGDGEVTIFPSTMTIVVVAEDSTTLTYTVNVEYYYPSTDATLSGLTATKGTLAPAFDAAIMEYALTLPQGTTSTLIGATANDSKSTVAGAGVVTTFPKVVSIVVTAEDGSIKTYIVNVDLYHPSTDATLSDLTSSAGTLSPVFDPIVLEYTLTLPQGTTSTMIGATANDSKSTIEGVGVVTTFPKDVSVVVTAEDGSTKTYLIHVDILVSVNNMSSGKLRVYPNPSNGIFNIETGVTQSKLTIYNATGVDIMRMVIPSKYNLDLSFLQNGIYFIRMEDGSYSSQLKLIKR